jgi:subtilisin-like proprotein convertase family protein
MMSLSIKAQTFNGTFGLIPDDLSTIVFEADVSGLPQTMDTTNFGLEEICFNITHTYDSDLTIRLKSPSGKIITLIESIGGDQDNFTLTCLNSFSTQSIFNGSGPFTGTWRPVGDLGTINDGSDPNGKWQLIIHDVYPADQGDLLDWSIQFGNEPAKPYTFASSRLPIVKIETGEATIVDDPKVSAVMYIISNEEHLDNNLADTTYSFVGDIGIEFRGSSSQTFPKKSYGFEVQDALGEDLDVSILGMPEESDWILNAHYSDKTLIRNNMTYELFRRMGHYASRTRLCELFINGEYRGIYSLMEKVKRNKNRVDISKLTTDDNSGSDVTGGYIFKIDRNTGQGDAGWTSQYSAPNNDDFKTNFLFEYPQDGDITDSQKAYLSSFVDSFETALYGPDFQDPEIGWRRYADENSFIDFMLIQEMSKNVDAYRLSTFLYKNKDTKDNKIHFGPVWDFDLGWMNADFCEAYTTAGWAWEINYKCPDGTVPFWWEKIIQDTTFMAHLKCRWESLRTSTLSLDSLNNMIDAEVAEMNGAYNHNFHIWSTLGTYVWPNPQPVPEDYPGEINRLKGWIKNRFKWLDYTIATSSETNVVKFETSHLDGLNWRFEVGNSLEDIYHWDFGDGNTASGSIVLHKYETVGTYNVTLTATNSYGCSSESSQIINIVNLETKSLESMNIQIYPNPVYDQLKIKFEKDANSTNLEINDMNGKLLKSQKMLNGVENVIDVSALPAGVYYCTIRRNDEVGRVRIVHLR